MRRVRSSTLASILMTGLMAGTAHAQAPAPSPEPVGRSVRAAPGTLVGTVRDQAARPLAGAVVSALGPESAFAVTDREGRFELRALPAGVYLLRAHLTGFGASPRELVEVRSNARESRAITLQRAILAAGFAQPVPLEERPAEEGGPARVSAHDQSETAWRIRHLRRSVLRNSTDRVPLDDEAFDRELPALLGRALESSASFAASLVHELPFSGEVNLLTTTNNLELPGGAGAFEMPRGVAFVTIGAPAGTHGDWAMQAAVTQGDISSWILAGSYTSRQSSPHALEVGLSYGTQEYGGGNPAALAAVTDGSRNVGAVQAFDHWVVSRHAALSYGARYAWYDYLDSSGLLSPRLGITLSPDRRTNVHAAVSQRMIAPGAEEFLPPSSGLWLPPERTFAPLEGATFRAERTREIEVGAERMLGGGYTLGVRRFRQGVSDQLATFFGINLPTEARVDLGHYYVASVGNVTTEGWTVSMAGPVGRGVRGTMEYSLADAHWHSAQGLLEAARWAPSVARGSHERFHDVTAAVEAEIPETHTRVHFIYKINSAYARPRGDGALAGRGARYDFQLTQTLPFMSFTSTEWQLLMAVRTLFRDPLEGASRYDELLVVQPPQRIVGGLLVKF